MSTPIPARLAHVMIFAKQMAPMIAFYEQVFGLSPKPSSDPGFVVLSAHDALGAGIALHRLPPHIADSIEVTSPPKWREDNAYKICFEVEDLEAFRQRIVDHGGQAKEPWEWEGTRFCECTDPEGNVVQILKRP